MGALTLDRLFLAAGGLVLLSGWGVWWASEVDRGAGVLAPMLGSWLATGAIAFGAWWRRREPGLRPLPSAAGLAMATPLALSGIAFSGPGGTIIAAAATVLAILPVTILLSERLARGGPTDRVGRRVAIGAVMLDFLLVPALGLGWSGGSRPEGLSEMYWLLLAVAILTPSVLDVTAALERSGSTTTAPDRRALRDLATALGVAVATLSIVVEVWPILVVPVLSIMLTAGFLVGYAIAPLERVAGSFREQRDLVVTVLEFERGRVAEAIHDGPLADLALLVQRLDRDGDPEVAALGRTISAELRSISHELRVPLLEDTRGRGRHRVARRANRRADAGRHRGRASHHRSTARAGRAGLLPHRPGSHHERRPPRRRADPRPLRRGWAQRRALGQRRGWRPRRVGAGALARGWPPRPAAHEPAR